jgi:hypothetical protein
MTLWLDAPDDHVLNEEELRDAIDNNIENMHLENNIEIADHTCQIVDIWVS